MPHLIPLLEDKSRRDVHQRAIKMLGEVGRDAATAIPALTQFAEDPDSPHHEQAKQVIGQIQANE